MIVVDCVQRTSEWFDARIGLPTSSHFNELVTPKTRKPSAQAFMYMCRLAFETLAGEPYEKESQSAFMARGGDMEDEARRWYEFRYDCDVRQVGLVLLDNRSAGCSPDGLVGDDGLLEIKVPGGKQHVAYMIDPGRLVDEYICQVHGQLWITERQWCHLISYNPLLRPVVVRIHPDEELIAALTEAVKTLQEQLQIVLKAEGFTTK